MKVASIVLTAIAATAGSTSINAQQPSAAPTTFEWRVKDRFRLFDQVADDDDRQRVQTLQDQILGAGPATPLESFYEPYLAAVSGEPGRREQRRSLRRSNFNEDGRSRRYARRYLYPERYEVEIRAASGAAQGQNCTYTSPLGQVAGSCLNWTSVPVASGATASQNRWRVQAPVVAQIDGAPPQALDISYSDELIVALGDSYISGEGNPDVPSRVSDEANEAFRAPSWGRNARAHRLIVPAEWWDEPCHRSLLSWPVISSFVHSARNAHLAVTLVHVGCSGATIPDIIAARQTDLPGGGDESRKQLEQVADLLAPLPGYAERRVTTTLLSVGGNDIHFAPVIATLSLPQNQHWYQWIKSSVLGSRVGAACPYRDSGPRLRPLCGDRESAEAALETLPKAYQELRTALANGPFDTARVFQTEYPNPLVDRDGAACDTDPGQPISEEPLHWSGFESLMGFVPWYIDKFGLDWTFELEHFAEPSIDPAGSHSGQLLSGVACDWRQEPLDSEVCQALWVMARLNEVMAERRVGEAGQPFHLVTTHLEAIRGHGLCNQSNGERLALPLVENGRWRANWRPGMYHPYAHDALRWFRTPNDSILTQFGFYRGRPIFSSGTVHPTYRAHMAIAQATYDSAFASAAAPAGVVR